MTIISPELQEQLVNRAESHYPNVLPYHNWEHAQDVMSATASLAIRSHNPEIINNKELLVIAAAWHDADYYLDAKPEFKTKEERSAALVMHQLPELSAEQLSIISSAIIDTTVEITPKTSIIGDALHIADLGYFAADEAKFMDRLQKMREEWGGPAWVDVVKRTKMFGHHVIEEIQTPLFQILPHDDAEKWLDSINGNLQNLQQKFEHGRLV